ncbi:MAG: hypothetical protein AAF908_04630 [Pseudomonadota bacterium]
MAAAIPKIGLETHARVQPAPSPELDRIRHCAMTCRLAPRGDENALCDLMRTGAVGGREAHLKALLRLLPIALDRRTVFHRPGTADVTFDEAWLMRLLESVRSGEPHNLIFGLASRLPRHFHGPILFLATGAAEAKTAEI